MDPQVQAQIPQIQGQMPQQPNPYAVMGAPIPGQYIPQPQMVAQAPIQVQAPIQAQAPMQQAMVATPQQDSFFDKLLKGIVDFIGKASAGGQTQQAVVQQPMQVPQQVMPGQYIPQQQAPVGAMFGQIGNVFESVANGMQNVATQAVQSGQQFVAQPAPQQAIDPQQLLQQQYQAYPQQQVVMQQPVVQQPIMQQPVMQAAPAPQQVQVAPEVTAPVIAPAPQAPIQVQAPIA